MFFVDGIIRRQVVGERQGKELHEWPAREGKNWGKLFPNNNGVDNHRLSGALGAAELIRGMTALNPQWRWSTKKRKRRSRC